MVDSQHRLANTQHLQASLVQHLHQLGNHQLTSQALVQWAETQHWQLIEGAYKTDRTPVAQILREILSDILLQWECLQAYHHETVQAGHGLAVEFPDAWLTPWLNQIQPTSENSMSTINFNDSVGNVNTGKLFVI